MTSQLVDYLRQGIRDGRFPAEARLPASRQLARELQISRSVVSEVYEILIAEGYLLSYPGRGTFVAPLNRGEGGEAAAAVSTAPGWLLPPSQVPVVDPPTPAGWLEFRVCQPSTAEFPERAWRRCWRAVLKRPLADDYAAVQGELALREAIATTVGHTRGLICRPEDIIITAGALQGIDLLARACLQPGDLVAVEEPGYRLALETLRRAGGVCLPVPVDGDGLRVARLAESRPSPKLVYTTPSHQFPTGERLSLARRLALLAWARTADGLILEDDYDSQFRYDAPPLPALASLDEAGRVVYVGTFSKTLTPALRLGYLIPPPAIKGLLCAAKLASDYHVPTLTQQALALFMREGHYARHVRRMGRVYAAKRAQLAAELSPLSGRVRLLGLEAGLHCVLEVVDGPSVEDIVARCAAERLIVRDVQAYAQRPLGIQGLVLGYGGLSTAEISQGTAILRRSLLG